MLPSEVAAGRYLRAPEGHDGGDGGTPTPSPTPTPTPSPSVSIESRVTTLDSVPEPLRKFYRQDGNAFILDDPDELRGHLKNIKDENKTIKGKLSQLKELEALGLTPEEAKNLVEERRQAEENRLKEEGNFEKLRQQMEENFGTKEKEWTGREQKLIGTISKILVDDQARAVLADPEIDGNPTLLLPLIRDRVKVTETDDGFDLQVLRSDGAPMLNKENQPASLKDLFLELKEKPEYAGAFKGVNQSGGGAPTGGGGGGGAPGGQKPRSKMSNIEKVKFIREHGQKAYDALPWE